MQTALVGVGRVFHYKNNLKICKRLEYIESENGQELIIESKNISKQLSNFINYLKRSEIY